MALTKISTGGVKDDTADEAKLKVSNAGSNGQFLSKQSGNTGGLTWATPPDNNTVYTHPNHSGEVTSTADGAQVIADNIVDEANLKVSNSPTNGQFLSAQSGNTGGLTWADAGGGIATEYDAWWNADDIDPIRWNYLDSNVGGVIGSGTVGGTYHGNLYRVTSLTSVGNGMSFSSGVFTFPSTGFWKIHISLATRRNEAGMAIVQLKVEKSTNSGTSYSTASGEQYEWNNSYEYNDYQNNDFYNFFNVTNASTTRVRFALWNSVGKMVKLHKMQCIFEFTKVA